MSFPRYRKYKDTGVEWLGEVPEHWALPPLYLRYEVLLGKMLDAKQITGEYLLPYVRNVDVQWDYVNVNELPELDIAPNELERFTLRRGDILVCEGGEVGRTAIWRGELDQCAFQKAIHRLRPRSSAEDPRFFYYCMRFASATDIFVAEGNPNTIPHLTGEKLRLYRFPCPPAAEQTLIAGFLDRETAKIDELVEKQRRLIELLKEKRQAVISHAVTKGLDPHTAMRPSGLEWLGDVPAHWPMARLRSLFGQEKRQDQSGKPVLSVYREYGVILKDSRDDNMNKTPDDLRTYQLVNPGDLVVNKMKAWQGSLGVSEVEGITSPDYVVFSPRHRECSDFLHLVLRSQRMVTVYRSISNGIRPAQWRLEPDLFLGLPVFLPPRQEQQALVSFITAQTSRFDVLTAEAQRAIDLLQERRTALISAAVTGQIDVRVRADQQLATTS